MTLTRSRRTVLIAAAIVALGTIALLSSLRTTSVSAAPTQEAVDRLAVLRESVQPSPSLDDAVSAAQATKNVVAANREHARELSGGLSLVPAVLVSPERGEAAGLCIVREQTVACRADENVAQLVMAEASLTPEGVATTITGLAPDGASEVRFAPADGTRAASAKVVRNAYKLTLTTPAGREVRGPDGAPIPGPAVPAIGSIKLLSSNGETVEVVGSDK